MTTVKISETDVFFLSYDEPNKEEHWNNLLSVYPHAKRVDGVKGFDNAHKECARRSTTARFVTIDGDNVISDPNFFNLEFSIPDNSEMSDAILSWAAKNVVNGLVYGNGGIKCWPTDVALNMNTHENADNETKKLDFCWDLNYVQLNNVYSLVFSAGSPFQAFRSGYREGIKMSLDNGKVLPPNQFKSKIWPKNYERLLTWCNVGADVENGLWAIYGARMACYEVNISKQIPHENISDYDWFKTYFKTVVFPRFSGGKEKCKYTSETWDYEKLYDATLGIGDKLVSRLGLELCDPTPDMSVFFKRMYTDPIKSNVALTTEKQTGWDK